MSNELTYKDNASHKGNNNFVTVIEMEISALQKVIQEIKNSVDDNGELHEIIDDLKDYITDHPTRKIIGLENKLKDGLREDLIDNAVLQKNRFARKVAKGQMSMIEQKIYIQVLSNINTIFHQLIRPMIIEGASKSQVDSTVLDKIIVPTHKAIVGFDHEFTADLVLGMLYFLTGKCHLVWRK